MRSDSLHRTLRRLYGARAVSAENALGVSADGGAAAGGRGADELEAELLARHARLYPRRKGWIMSHLPRTRAGRVLLVAGVLLAIGVAACNAPTSYKAEVGQTLHIAFDIASAGAHASVEEMVAYLDKLDGVEDVSVNERNINGELRLDAMLWGQGLDTQAIAADLQARFPFLAGGAVSFEPLEGEFEGNWGDRLAHNLFELHIDAGDEESARQQIIDQLRAQGHDGPVEVEFTTENGQTTIDIQIEDTVEE